MLGFFDWLYFCICSVSHMTHVISSQVPCKIIHVTKGSQLEQHVPELVAHFQSWGSPVMMGELAAMCICEVALYPRLYVQVVYIYIPHVKIFASMKTYDLDLK